MLTAQKYTLCFYRCQNTQWQYGKIYSAIDNDQEDTNADRTKYVEQVIASLMKNDQPAYGMTKAIVCSVKRKSK